MDHTPVATVMPRARRIRVIRSALSSSTTSVKDKFVQAARQSKFQQYKHGKIQADTNVRLLAFQKPPNDLPLDRDDIYVSLLNVSFDDLGKTYPYEALSYHWGHDDAVHPIYFLDSGREGSHFYNMADIVNLLRARGEVGQSGTAQEDTERSSSKLVYKRLYVKPNLYHALQHLRRQGVKDEFYPFWVDAICINQEDEEEKKLQVSRMAEIYSKASRVCIWLGPGNSRTDNAMDFIKELLQVDDPKDLMVEQRHAKCWNNLVTLMTKEWFSRRWVIQELALARDATVHCGAKEVHWDDFRDAISLLGLHVDEIRELFAKSTEFEHNFWAIGDIDLFGASVLVDVIPNIFRKHANKNYLEPALGLESLVSTYAMFDSADPRDTVMAMRNIARETIHDSQYKPSSRQPPELDYKKDLFEVYSDFVDWVVKTSNSLDILCRHWARPERGADDPRPPHYPKLVTLPSWILETSKRTKNHARSQGRLRGDSLVGLPGFASYNASNGMTPAVFLGKYNRKDTVDNPTATHTIAETCGAIVRSTSRRMPEMQAVKDAMTATSEALNINNHVAAESSNKRGHPSGLETSETGAASKRRKNNHSTGTSAPTPNLPTISRYAPVQSDQFASSGTTPLQSLTLTQTGMKFDRSLYVEGLRMDTITWRSDPIPDGVIPKTGLEKCGWDLQEFIDSDEQGKSFEIDKVLRTLIADRGADGRNPPTWYHRACLNCLVNHTPNGHMNTRDLLRSKQPEFVKQFLKRVQAVTWERVFLETGSGGSTAGSPKDTTFPGAHGTSTSEKLVGLGPEGTKKGDIVCVLFGCSVPVILRETSNEEGETCFKFIGEAFIYGKMDGEAISTLSHKELEEGKEKFRLI